MAKGKKLTLREQHRKLETDKQFRKQVFRQVCEHVKRGFSVDCYSLISEKMIYDLLNRFPEEWPREEFEQALREGKDGWEDIGRRQANGSCLGNSRTWYYNMSNRYGWREKHEVDAKHEGSLQVNVVNYAVKKPSKDTQE